MSFLSETSFEVVFKLLKFIDQSASAGNGSIPNKVPMNCAHFLPIYRPNYSIIVLRDGHE